MPSAGSISARGATLGICPHPVAPPYVALKQESLCRSFYSPHEHCGCYSGRLSVNAHKCTVLEQKQC